MKLTVEANAGEHFLNGRTQIARGGDLKNSAVHVAGEAVDRVWESFGGAGCGSCSVVIWGVSVIPPVGAGIAGKDGGDAEIFEIEKASFGVVEFRKSRTLNEVRGYADEYNSVGWPVCRVVVVNQTEKKVAPCGWPQSSDGNGGRAKVFQGFRERCEVGAIETI